LEGDQCVAGLADWRCTIGPANPKEGYPMEPIRQTYLAWLRDAHAMEKQALSMMEHQLSRLKNYPQLEARLRTHVTETEEQLAALDRLLSRHEIDSSMVKDALGKLTALGQSLSGMFASDEVVKGTLASYTFEQMEIASYRILITTAEQMGDHDAVEVFTRCLEQEEAMADWLAGHSAEITRLFLRRSELELPAQR
jgi:ferritin-like metal-binding protein YciE